MNPYSRNNVYVAQTWFDMTFLKLDQHINGHLPVLFAICHDHVTSHQCHVTFVSQKHYFYCILKLKIRSKSKRKSILKEKNRWHLLVPPNVYLFGHQQNLTIPLNLIFNPNHKMLPKFSESIIKIMKKSQ